MAVKTKKKTVSKCCKPEPAKETCCQEQCKPVQPKVIANFDRNNMLYAAMEVYSAIDFVKESMCESLQAGCKLAIPATDKGTKLATILAALYGVETLIAELVDV